MAEASPIGRGKNLTLETILSFLDAIPLSSMPKNEFLAYGEKRMKGWRQTHSQIARQLALYFEDNDGICHPRFSSKISTEEAAKYGSNWARKYFAPNPFTPSLKIYKGQETNLYAYIRNKVVDGQHEFSSICKGIFGTELNNLDKVRVYLSNFTDLLISDDYVTLNESVKENENEKIHPHIDSDSLEEYFHHFDIDNTYLDSDVIDVNMAVINPLKDSYSDEELVDQLKKMNDSLGTTGIHLFGLKFGKFLADKQVKELSEIAAKAGIPESFGAELNKLKNVYKAIHEHKFGVSFYDEIRVSPKDISSAHIQNDREFDYLRAMRTKPFLLLAGISGTGKSRIVKQMAFDSCPDEGELRADPTSPGNYCLIEVKPNWHDSTELLGYESRIGGAHYQLTAFVKFLVKAMRYPNVPFFVCLDEMNLAPVEQYFAEFLSVLESRTKIDGHIVSDPLVKAAIFANNDYELKLQDELFGLELKEEVTADGKQRIVSGKLPDEAQPIYESLREHGLRIPDNVIVIGSVNMDETTHQFSRKVIDRAMTIEMNLPKGNPFMDFFDKPSNLAYPSIPNEPSLYLATETRASDVIQALAKDNPEKTENLKQQVAQLLTELNDALEGTPFKVAYRVQNKLMLYFHQLWLEKPDEEWDKVLQTAADQILMMKVLPRIEGDEELLEKPLERLAAFCENYDNARKKIEEMTERLNLSRFTSFWP